MHALAGWNTITFERFDVGSSFSHIPYISREYGLSSYMKVKVEVAGAKKVENSYSRNIKL